MENETVSRYYQKQYERFIKQTEKKDLKDLKEAFIKREPDEDKPEEETMYTRLRENPRIIQRR